MQSNKFWSFLAIAFAILNTKWQWKNVSFIAENWLKGCMCFFLPKTDKRKQNISPEAYA